MNIIFEGINGTGKTSIIDELEKIMLANKLEVCKISEINEISPLAGALEEMCKYDTFLRMKKSYNTVLTESLILAADYHYIQEYARDKKGYKIFDRDIFTQIVYQKYLIEMVYGENNDFFEAWEKCMKFNMKKIDVVIYVEAPFEVCLERTEKRENRCLDEEQRKMMKDLYCLQKEYIIEYTKEKNIPLVLLDGTLDIRANALKVFDYIVTNLK